MAPHLRLTSAVLLAALAVAGCGAHQHPAASGPGSIAAAPPAGAGGVSTVALLTKSVEKVNTAGSARIDGTVTTTMTGSSAGTMSIRITGAEQWKPTIKAKLTMSGLQVAGKDSGAIKVILTPKALYMSMPMLAELTHKPWTELSFSALGKSGGPDLSQLVAQAQQTAPAQYVAQLTKSADVHLVGTETIDGVATKHYSGNVDLAKALSAASPALRSSWATLAKQGVRTEHVDLWLDAAGQPRRIQASLSTPAMTISYKLHLSHYGAKVVVVPPPAAQVFDLSKLAKGLGTASTS